jgi:hypothetical protein
MSTPAFTELNAAFCGPFDRLGRDRAHDAGTVVLSWPSVPVEIIHAAGYQAALVRSSETPTPAADRVLEQGVFPGRLRQLAEAALAGRLAHVAAIVIPRTSDPDYKFFLYLREFSRRGIGGPLPPVLLFDLLQSDAGGVPAHDRGCARDLLGHLCRLSGRDPSPGALQAEIMLANAARRAARQLMSMRTGQPRISGAEALPLLGAFWHLPFTRYAVLAATAAGAIAARAPLAGLRVLLAGTPVDSPALHAAIEAQQVTVVDEFSPFGSDVAGDDVAAGTDPFSALADRYRRMPATARAPVKLVMRRIERSLVGVDAAVLWFPPDDATFGWDYPRLSALLAQRGVPHMILTTDPATPQPPGVRQEIRQFLDRAATQPARRHG